MKTKIQNFQIVGNVDNQSVKWTALCGSGDVAQCYPISGTLNQVTNTAHLDSDCQTLQDDQFEGFDICATIEAR